MKVWRAIRGLLLLITLMGGLASPGLAAGQAAEPGRWYTFTAENGLAGNIVQAIWEDGVGGIWFGTENGASRYDGREWQTYRVGEGGPGLIDNNVWAITGAGDDVWFATSNGVSRLRGGEWRSYGLADGLPIGDVRAILVASNGTVWAGTFGGGVVRKRQASERWERFDLSALVSDPNVIIQSLWEDAEGRMWFGTNGAGAVRLDANGLERFEFKQASRNTIWAMHSAPGSPTLWLATFQGIVSITGNKVAVVGDKVGDLAISTTETLAAATTASDGWFGTRAHGVFHRTSEGWRRYTVADGLSRNYVQTILADRRGRVWFGTRGGGVTLLNPAPPAADGLRLEIATRDIQRNVDLAPGQATLGYDQNNLQWVFALPAAWVPAQHLAVRLWLDGPGGASPPVTLSSAAAVEAQIASPPFVDLVPGSYRLHAAPLIDGVAGREQTLDLTIRSAPPSFGADAIGISAEGAPVSDGATLAPVLFGSTRQVEISFSATDDDPAAQLAYEYRLLDPPGEWQRTGEPRARLALPQGTHRIAVRALDRDGNRSAETGMTVVVPPPRWQELALYLTIILVPSLLGAAGGAWWYRRWSGRQALLRAVRGHVIPYDVGPLISAPERYIGRQHVLDALLGRIDHNSFYIYGEKRIGKTSLLAQVRQRLLQRNALQPDRRYIPVFFNMQNLPQEQFWRSLMRAVADAVGGDALGGLRLAGPAYDDLDAQDDLDLLVRACLAVEPGRQPLLVLLLDEVDTLQRFDPVIRQRFRAFCQHVQDHLQVILVGVRPPQAEAGDTSPWYNIFAPLPLEPLDRAATVFLIRKYNQNPYAYTPEAEQSLLDWGDRKPFDTQWLCAEAVRAMLAGGRTTARL
ncbi:MAG TPA: two-component regulator propeller domain-containing protein, partial [Herpetosiphonaceae bacterium]